MIMIQTEYIYHIYQINHISTLIALLAPASFIIAILVYLNTKKQDRLKYLRYQLENFYTPLSVHFYRLHSYPGTYDTYIEKLVELFDEFTDIEKHYGYLCDPDVEFDYTKFMFEFEDYYNFYGKDAEITVEVKGFDRKKNLEEKQKNLYGLSFELSSKIFFRKEKITDEIYKKSANWKQVKEREKQKKETLKSLQKDASKQKQDEQK